MVQIQWKPPLSRHLVAKHLLIGPTKKQDKTVTHARSLSKLKIWVVYCTFTVQNPALCRLRATCTVGVKRKRTKEREKIEKKKKGERKEGRK